MKLLLLLFINIIAINCFKLPGVQANDYNQGDPVEVFVNKLTSSKTQIPYPYYSMSVCKPEKRVDIPGSLGAILSGDRIQTSMYQVHMLENVNCQVLCSKTLENKEIKRFMKLIKEEYRGNLYYFLIFILELLMIYLLVKKYFLMNQLIIKKIIIMKKVMLLVLLLMKNI